MNTDFLSSQRCILKVMGKHGLVFKTRHDDVQYLQTMAEELMAYERTDFTEYEIHVSDHADSEMTEPEHLLHIDAEELKYNY